jgi:hypothetical protein
MDQNEHTLYTERLSSNKTQALFAALAVIFAGLAFWRNSAAGFPGWAALLTLFSIFFLFYILNYRTLIITLTRSTLTLKFGIFRWRVPLDNIAECQLDHIQGFMYYGGAGIHFMTISGRYRASFNFLEYPRLLIAFKKKIGPVQDISFSTRRPDELIQLIQGLTPR